MTTTWNAADKAAGIALSSTNHIATGSSGNNSVRGTTNHTTGKWYIEYKGITIVGSLLIGFAEASQSLTTNTMSAAMGGDGGTPGHISGAFLSTENLSANIAGHTLSFAIDLVANKLWGRLDAGAWVGDGLSAGDPAAGTHGNALTGITTAIFPFAFLQNGGTVTINAGDNAFDNSPPSGFIAWDAPLILPPRVRPMVIF